MSAQLLKPIQELHSLSQSLLLSLSPAHPSRPAPIPPPPDAFLAADAALAAAIYNAHAHQRKQRRIEELKSEVLLLDAQWRVICQELESGRRDLVQSIKEGKKRCQAIEEAKNGTSESLSIYM